MERLHLLGVALGLAALAGLNLYLTVFVTGLAINQHWIVLSPAYESLGVLGQPLIITIAGVLYFLEFFADKIPWIDTAWDAVHTIIRPIGGALLAIQVLGHSSATFDVLVVLLAGSTSLMAHTAKSATRLVANTSPEPFSNIALSLGEDAAVFGGLALIHYNPLIALGVVAVAIVAFIYFIPKLLRAMKAKVWLVFQKLNLPANLTNSATLPTSVPARFLDIFARENVLDESIAWAAPCLSTRTRGIPGNVFGALVATNEEPHKLLFLGRKSGRGFARTIELENSTITRQPKFLSENLLITPPGAKSAKFCFVFPRSNSAIVEQIANDLSEKTRPAPAPLVDAETAPLVSA